jgi:hypothetical protein
MTIHEYLMKALQDDARRAGERDRLLREARRARRARRQRLVADQLADECRASPDGGQCLVCLALLDVRQVSLRLQGHAWRRASRGRARPGPGREAHDVTAPGCVTEARG